jgi:hypothetical protein
MALMADEHHAMCSGLCSPTKRAKAWIAESLWLRVL